MGKLDRTWVAEADEQSRAWWEIVLASFCHGGLEFYVGGIADLLHIDRSDTFDRIMTTHVFGNTKAGLNAPS
jgi:hypothetical protein